MWIGETISINHRAVEWRGRHTAKLERLENSGPFPRYRLKGIMVYGERDLPVEVYFTGEGAIYKMTSEIAGGKSADDIQAVADLCQHVTCILAPEETKS